MSSNHNQWFLNNVYFLSQGTFFKLSTSTFLVSPVGEIGFLYFLEFCNFCFLYEKVQEKVSSKRIEENCVARKSYLPFQPKSRRLVR